LVSCQGKVLLDKPVQDISGVKVVAGGLVLEVGVEKRNNIEMKNDRSTYKQKGKNISTNKIS